MKIAIYGREFNIEFSKYMEELLKKLNENKVEIFLYNEFYNYLLTTHQIKPKISGLFNKNGLHEKVNFMFSIGGDGSFLETITYIAKTNIPVIGINSGRLGFLANISKEQISDAIDSLLAGKYSYEQRSLIELKTSSQMFGEFNYALNEFTILRKDTLSMITIHAYINNEYLNSYWADGLIISTPTGSTAYSLSAGGPIVHPESKNFIISPITPHNLSVRPLIVPDSCSIRLKAEGRCSNFMASLDHRSEIFDSSVELLINKANFYINIVKFPSTDFFNTLRNKLFWGVDKRN
ncbi:MAG: NAD kinase [Bacteroidia bacterium]|nr:NAD kinase [Bacteroidia bacterium]